MQGSQFGRAAASGTGTQPTQGGPGFGPGNNPGVEGSAYGRSTASDASSGRSDGHNASFFHSSEKEEVIDTEADSGRGKARSEEERDTNHANPLTRISSETRRFRGHASSAEVDDGARLWRLGECELAGQDLWPELQ